ncbi:MAG TPA: tetratricopeptide repeat protein [Xanthomonadaceae bacterium]|nr:tetratricopeptide repeat protein [Xanthomonadaceae bacterium]
MLRSLSAFPMLLSLMSVNAEPVEAGNALDQYRAAAERAHIEPDAVDFGELWQRFLEVESLEALAELFPLLDGLWVEGAVVAGLCAERWTQIEAARSRLLWSLAYQYAALSCAESLERDVDGGLRERLIGEVLTRYREQGDGSSLYRPIRVVTLHDVYAIAALGELRPMGMWLWTVHSSTGLRIGLVVRDEFDSQSVMYFDPAHLPMLLNRRDDFVGRPSYRRAFVNTVIDRLGEIGVGAALAHASQRERNDQRKADALWKRAVDSGEPTVILRVAEDMLFRNPLRKAQDQGFDLLLGLAEAGWGEALALLAVAHRVGQRVTADAEAEQALRARAISALGDGPGHLHLSRVVMRHGRNRGDSDQAIADIVTAAAADDVDALMALFRLAEVERFADSHAHLRDQRRARLERAAALGHPVAQHELGMRLVEEGQREDALGLLEAAAASHLPESLWELSRLRIAEGLASDDDPGIQSMVERAAASGHAEALWLVAQRHFDAITDEGDEETSTQAAQWATEAAIHGHAAAAVWFAERLAEDNPKRSARRHARRIVEPMAEQGEASAQRVLASLIEKDDPREARRWYLRAANQGDGEAMLGLGRMFRTGRGGERNPRRAREWFMKALDAGIEEAQGDIEALDGRRR